VFEAKAPALPRAAAPRTGRGPRPHPRLPGGIGEVKAAAKASGSSEPDTRSITGSSVANRSRAPAARSRGRSQNGPSGFAGARGWLTRPGIRGRASDRATGEAPSRAGRPSGTPVAQLRDACLRSPLVAVLSLRRFHVSPARVDTAWVTWAGRPPRVRTHRTSGYEWLSRSMHSLCDQRILGDLAGWWDGLLVTFRGLWCPSHRLGSAAQARPE
jgi:hypothetical protein